MRANQTWACECGLRQEKTDSCRRCASERVGNLADPETNAVAYGMARKRSSHEPKLFDGPRFLFLALGSVGLLAAIALLAHPWLFTAAGVLWALAGSVLLVLKLDSRRAEDVAFASELASPPIPGPDTTSFIGTVRASATIRSFLALEPCVAWRVTGRACRAPVDDAAITDFDVVADDGRVALVRGGAATVLLPVAEPIALRSLTDAQRRFLEHRGHWHPSGVTLGEAVLLPGERVALEGNPERVPRPDGYRGTVEDLLFEDRPGYPLTIRAVE